MPAAAELIDLDDAALLAGVAGGEREAFRLFYERHAGQVTGYLRRLCGDPELAEEIAQETFLAVWQRAGSYSPALGAPLGWLYTITRNRLVDHWRRRQAIPMAGEDLDKMLATPIQDNAELVLSLNRALECLSVEQRRAVHMAYFGGYTYEETARALELPVGTLKSRIRTALGVLRSRLEART